MKEIEELNEIILPSKVNIDIIIDESLTQS